LSSNFPPRSECVVHCLTRFGGDQHRSATASRLVADVLNVAEHGEQLAPRTAASRLNLAGEALGVADAPVGQKSTPILRAIDKLAKIGPDLVGAHG